MDDARHAVIRWANEGRIPAAHLADALRAAGVTPSAAQWNAFVQRLLAWLAAAALAASLLFFVAANWQALGRFGKFALVEGALVAALAVTWWRGLDTTVGRAALLAAALATGVLLALVGQVYQTGADTFELFAAWAAAIAVWVAASRQPALWLLWIAIVDVAIVLWFRVEAARGLGLVELLLPAVELLLALATLFGGFDGGAHQRFADLQAAPVLEHRDPADLPVGQQARGADRVVALAGEKMHGLDVLIVPFELCGHGLLGDEDRFADAPQIGIVLLPVGEADVDLTHQQTPNFLAGPVHAPVYARPRPPTKAPGCRCAGHRRRRSGAAVP